MNILKFRNTVLLFSLMVFALSASVCKEVRAQDQAMDPAATDILKRMTDYLGSLKKFSVHTQNTLEELPDFGHRVDYEVAANVIISRPNRLRAERRGEMVDQVFYYDGKTLTLYNPADKVYAMVAVPETLEGMFEFMYWSLGFSIPISDLLYADAFRLLMQDVTLAEVIGQTFIDGVKCDHLLFSRPGVDFQVWVAQGSRPLPHKYVVTDTTSPALLSIIMRMSDWNMEPVVADAQFAFVPPKGTQKIDFMPFTTGENK